MAPSKSTSHQRSPTIWLRRAPDGREADVSMERGVEVGEHGQQPGDVSGSGWDDLRCHDPGRRGIGGRIDPEPLPAHRLGERGVHDDVRAPHRRRAERPATRHAPTPETGVERVDVGRRDLRHGLRPEGGHQVAVDDRTMRQGGGRRPVGHRPRSYQRSSRFPKLASVPTCSPSPTSVTRRASAARPASSP